MAKAKKPAVWETHFQRTIDLAYLWHFSRCMQCGAMVDNGDQEKHYDWHRAQERAR